MNGMLQGTKNATVLAAVLLGLGVCGAPLTDAQTQPRLEGDSWVGGFVEADAVGRTVTLKAQARAGAVEDMGRFESGDDVVLVIERNRMRVGQSVLRIETAGAPPVVKPSQKTFRVPATFVSANPRTRVVTVKVAAAGEALAAVGPLALDSWVKLTMAPSADGVTRIVTALEPIRPRAGV